MAQVRDIPQQHPREWQQHGEYKHKFFDADGTHIATVYEEDDETWAVLVKMCNRYWLKRIITSINPPISDWTVAMAEAETILRSAGVIS